MMQVREGISVPLMIGLLTERDVHRPGVRVLHQFGPTLQHCFLIFSVADQAELQLDMEVRARLCQPSAAAPTLPACPTCRQQSRAQGWCCCRMLWEGGREGLQPQAQPQAASCKQAPTEESEARKADTGGNDKKAEERRRHNTKR
jgi:hypothetical protein